MKKRVKDLFLKALLLGVKGLFVAPLIFFFIYEAYITQNEESSMVHIQYVAIITTLCWCLIFWIFLSYKLKHYLFVFLIFIAFLQMFFFDIYIQRAHQMDRCLDKGKVWDFDEHICRDDCFTWNRIQKCVPLTSEPE